MFMLVYMDIDIVPQTMLGFVPKMIESVME
jgi:hypothetical protein